jgi:hypothetical protein
VILTEAEAYDIKWCPFARVVPYDRNQTAAPFNRYVEVGGAAEPNPATARCLASECMAWLWVDTPDKGANRQGCYGLANTRAGEI